MTATTATKTVLFLLTSPHLPTLARNPNLPQSGRTPQRSRSPLPTSALRSRFHRPWRERESGVRSSDDRAWRHIIDHHAIDGGGTPITSGSTGKEE